MIGIGIGVAGAVALARIIEALLYEIPPLDPLTYIVVCVLLGSVALLVSYVPALRASRTDPMVNRRAGSAWISASLPSSPTLSFLPDSDERSILCAAVDLACIEVLGPFTIGESSGHVLVPY